ncbi:MAG: uroporphyrinogen synthase [Proteobacteria bacterium]|nr:uroporphyrinogen synthase [Pseudomonadota bacterium]
MRVLVTRPAHQAETLVQKIEAAGGQAVLLPTIEIAAPASTAALDAVLDRLPEYAFAIFISPNAVRQFLPLVRARGGVPSGLQLAAVGQGTLRTLNDEGFDKVLAPLERFDSEALLELLPPAVVAEKDILIVRGEGGHKLLGVELSARGARVAYAECYRRVPPRLPDAANLARLRRGEIDILVHTGGRRERTPGANLPGTGVPRRAVCQRTGKRCGNRGRAACVAGQTKFPIMNA